ncbi:hypothetical protein [Arenibacter latericius]|uniref:hypothetical protein n=1 Tax=Arenibacter latericius TaxID=86104 RepID=UPI000416430A|nr:hypothetical protein [Arenibacter latericius]MDX1364799.1 hypothetical protein [Arenibacter latericius]
MRSLSLLFIFITLMACGGKDSPKAPIAAQLVFPEKNSECTTGKNVNDTNTSVVEFKWLPSNHTESYELRVTNLNTNNSQTVVVNGTSAELPLEKGSPHSWAIISKNNKTIETAKSETWFFYNSGVQTSYTPFPAAVITPKTGSTISKDTNNEVLLKWESTDLDNDLAGYEVYFSTTNPPITKIGTLAANQSEIKVSVNANTTYYWRITTFDLEGNKASNSISEFRIR